MLSLWTLERCLFFFLCFKLKWQHIFILHFKPNYMICCIFIIQIGHISWHNLPGGTERCVEWGRRRAEPASSSRGTLWSYNFLQLYGLLYSRSSPVCLCQTFTRWMYPEYFHTRRQYRHGRLTLTINSLTNIQPRTLFTFGPRQQLIFTRKCLKKNESTQICFMNCCTSTLQFLKQAVGKTNKIHDKEVTDIQYVVYSYTNTTKSRFFTYTFGFCVSDGHKYEFL